MEKEVETAGEMVNPEVSGGFQGFKEAVYNFLENFFGWLSTHQGVTIALIIIVLGIMIWLMLRAQNFRRQAKNEVFLKKKELEKKDKLIEEQETKLANLQKKMDDQQTVVSDALLRTLKTLTGYDAGQLQIFFKSLTQGSENPLHTADHQAINTPAGQYFEGDSDDSAGINDPEDNLASNEAVSGDDSSEGSDAQEKLASGDDSSETDETTEKPVSDGDSLEDNAAEEETASDKDASEENDSKNEKPASNDDPEEAAEKK